MSIAKATIRIKLISPVDIHKTISLRRTVRGDGPDYWEAELTTRTNEGKLSISRYNSEDKQNAINQAYKALELARIEEWYPSFYDEQLERWKHLFSEDNKGEHRFNTDMMKVRTGEYSREGFTQLWEQREDYTNKAVRLADERAAMDARCDLDPPKKWKWYHWFYNPTE
jgi:hypothetical protein